MKRILADEVICGSDDETHWAQWLWPHGGVDFEKGYFVVERAIQPDDDGERTVWASRSGQFYSCFDGIQQCTLDRCRIDFQLKDRGKTRLKCEDLSIEFEIGDLEFQQLRLILMEVFLDLNQLHINA